VVWAFGFTYAMLFIIDKVTPVRVSAKGEEMGLDVAEHGEQAYI
jgi:Amt family ammonium transporter